MWTIRYIFHDCFVVSCPEATLVFDYWRDPVGNDDRFPDFLGGINPELPLYVFVSHSHKDHFNPAVFGWAERFPYARFLLSRETWKRCRHIFSPTSVYAGPKLDPALAVGLRRGETWSDGKVNVRAFGSTDIGVSWMVDIGGRRFFHAGDLNAWVWRDSSTPGEQKMAWNAFTSVLDEIVAEVEDNQLDVAFFPVDSRIGSGYYEGAREFLSRLRVVLFFPMHYGLGDEAEQAIRRLDASREELYLHPVFGRCAGIMDPMETVTVQ